MSQKEIRALCSKAISCVNTLYQSSIRLENILNISCKKRSFHIENCPEYDSFWSNAIKASTVLCLYFGDTAAILSEKRDPVIKDAAKLMNLSVHVVDGFLTYSCPYPPPRKGYFFRAYRPVIEYLTAEKATELKTLDYKYVHLIYVYPPKARGRLPDFDNFDTKSLIDDAVRTQPGTDNPVSTAILSIGVETDQLPAMCYVAVLDRLLSQPEIIPFLSPIYADKNNAAVP